MPGRLLAFVGRATQSSSSSKLDHINSFSPPLLPPYSVSPPPRQRSIEQSSMEHLKRHSLGGRHHSDKKSPRVEPHKPASLAMIIESPPLLFYASPQNSTGALLSGRLKLDVADPSITVDTFEMQLLATVTNKKPVAKECRDCAIQTSEIHKWIILTAPIALNKGEHQYPFSSLLPGHLPATTHGSLSTLDYHLFATATTSTGEKITLDHVIDIKRAILPPATDKHSVRIFPPTNLTATVKLPGVIYPIGDFNVEMRIQGIVTKKPDSQTQWRLRRLQWKIEEIQKSVSPACAKHTSRLGGDNKGIAHEDMRVIAHEDIKTGWKTDFSAGNIEVEFKAAVDPRRTPICNVESENGMNVRHNLVIEMVVSEEWAPLKKLNQPTPTGSARVLRTQFNLLLTERGGMGISWDEEQPPMYEDVPASPPGYAAPVTVEDYSGDLTELDHEVERLSLGS
ncbi:uncharacterized protein BDZ99DRAFT_97825 [Mytilinidion resinicola]|uniref:LDB19 N-terminal domain-containing protein n=1 Tax=Mytilinidion resinicola TaxID=574789 RepID=A0A6A6YCM0_9PEZI|nr:uncharacterized protein BDZ99DRAFT_97825 [Mytilinidion resinicola]KAF2806561.1 hypothetical protein BDZ99DRAFT_97825 [Mytilinidion resinicola]